MSIHSKHSKANWLFDGHGSQIYKATMARLIQPLYGQVTKDMAQIFQHGTVLDVGAGTGELVIHLASALPALKITGIDLSKDMIDIARTQAATDTATQQITFEVQSVTALTYAPHTFDMVVSTISIHHWDNRVKGIQECLRVMKENGVLLIYEFGLVRYSEIDRDIRLVAQSADCEISVMPIRVGWFPLPIFVRYLIRRRH